ncbi:MAG: hypothetical protein AVDCRST_MAG20-325 [uncultured Acidimicrobiales bacterium]|uniref:Uncharacterized protein n=1 Tax=uncultured Acidimicrobiales bacterium TaxID=310071 RepID=A0A6J4H768_9ACTN|nr:MAG: hypothetical protein AVDCRST_MAG20-325 [uncultured Acidimicrobiales bacterium]
MHFHVLSVASSVAPGPRPRQALAALAELAGRPSLPDPKTRHRPRARPGSVASPHADLPGEPAGRGQSTRADRRPPVPRAEPLG